jgi:ArsR family transcriptional regulator
VFRVKSQKPNCTTDPRIIELAEALKVLSDPNRLRIMCLLSKGEQCVCEVEQKLSMSQQLSSHHLNVLKEAGLLEVRKVGTWSHYSIDKERLKEVDEVFEFFLDHRRVKQATGRPTPACCS